MRIPDSLYSLVDHGIIEEVVRPLMSGKEAQVYLVVSGGEQRVAKIYKEAQNRTFQNRADYTEGRKVRNSRDQRAMSKGSRHGRAQNEAAWRSTEVDMIYRLRQAGVRVPVPHHFIDGVLIMELVTDEEGYPAPRLGDLMWEPDDAIKVYEHLLGEVVRMLSVGVVHGDLSDFNVLMAADGPVIIDFPQSVDASSNQNARKLLLRDVANLHRFLGKFAPERRALPYAEEMWELYKRNALTPDTRLTGRYRAAHKPASTDAVMGLIVDAARDERRRREQRGLSMRGAAQNLEGGPRDGQRDAPRGQHPQRAQGHDSRSERGVSAPAGLQFEARSDTRAAPSRGQHVELRAGQPAGQRADARGDRSRAWRDDRRAAVQRGEAQRPLQRGEAQRPQQRGADAQSEKPPRQARSEPAQGEHRHRSGRTDAHADPRPGHGQRPAAQRRPDGRATDPRQGRGAQHGRDTSEPRGDARARQSEPRGAAHAGALARGSQERADHDNGRRAPDHRDEQRTQGQHRGEGRQGAAQRAARSESSGRSGLRSDTPRIEHADAPPRSRFGGPAQSVRAPLPDSALGTFTERPPSSFGERRARGRESSAADERSRRDDERDAQGRSISPQRNDGSEYPAQRRGRDDR